MTELDATNAVLLECAKFRNGTPLLEPTRVFLEFGTLLAGWMPS